ncbi:UNVERIFIED_ORG: hypothetical protein GGE11_000011 [Mycolicibacterium obuense]
MSLSDWLSDTDYHWRQRLQPVNLVIEANFSIDEVRHAQQRYGAAARQLFLRGVPYRKFIRRYPALTLLVLVGHAALEYDQGKYWDSFWDELGIPRDADFETEIRKNLFDLLDKFSLARFPRIEEASTFRYVMTLTLHAGIPVHCLGDLLRVINDHIRQGRAPHGAALIEWLEEPGKEHRIDPLDVPVRNFIANGAQFAVDILDRIIELVQEVAANTGLLDADLDASTTGLPDVLLDELIKQLRDAPPTSQGRRLTGRHNRQPSIEYNVDDDEIVLVLPTPETDVDLPWRVSFDGDVRQVHPSRRWGGDAMSAQVAVPGPVREIVVAHPSGVNSALPLVMKSDPLLTFDKSGRWIPRRDGLKESVWAVFPEEFQLADTRAHQAVDAQDSGSPAGWRGWRSAFIDLTEITALQLLTSDRVAIGTPHSVRKDARPSFLLGSPVVGVSALDGRTVYNTRPWVLLPPSQTDPAPEWLVRVRHFGASEWIVEESWRAEDIETCVDPFDDDENPQLGLFEIVVNGPLGADARYVVFMAEGLHVEFDTPIRVPRREGLTPCTAEVTADHLAVSPSEPLRFGPRQLEQQIRLQSGDLESRIAVRPPHVEIRAGVSGEPAAWRMTPEVCDPADFAEDRFAAIRVPGIDHVQFAYISSHGDLLQRDPNSRRRHGDVVESRIQQFADTVRNNPGGRVVATLSTHAGPLDVTVLFAYPRRLASGVQLHEGTLKFFETPALDDLAVYVWSSTAPWRAPEVLPVSDGMAALPPALVDAGDLRCQLFIDDPWVLIEPPPMPPASAFVVEQVGWREDGTPSQVKLSRYLGTQRSAPIEVGAIPEVWAAMARLHADGKAERFDGLTQVLAVDPRFALERLGNSMIPAGDKMAMLIRSELVNHDFSAEETLNDLHAHPWFGCMVELADLPSLHNRREQVRDERAQTLAYLQDRGGVPLMDLLRTGTNDHAFGACFDGNVFRWTEIPGNRIEEKLREIQQIPLAQLHHDNLRAGVYEAFCRRSEWLASGWTAHFAMQTGLVATPIRHASLLAHEAVVTRHDRVRKIDASANPWILMSVESLTLALLARLEAHGRIDGRYLDRGLLRTWSRMAKLCPTIVANDLLIAEAVVLYDRRGDLTGEDT